LIGINQDMKLFYHIGRYFIMLGHMLRKPEKSGMYWQEILRQMYDIGVGSLPIVAMISFFIGAVTSVQTAFQLLNSFIPDYYVGFIVRDSMLLELAPTITCLALAGKIGSNIASELGTMRITEQIDALEIMGVNTEGYLVGPKIMGAIIMVPFLIVIAAFLGMLGGYAAVAATDAVENPMYIKGLLVWFKPYYINFMVIKSVVFGFLITSISAYHGYYVKGGALEIGKASTKAVVYSSIAVLLADYVLAILLT